MAARGRAGHRDGSGPLVGATIDANLTATFLTARAYLRHAAAARAGCLVLVGSTAGRFGEAGHADYAAAKSAITGGLLQSLKNEVVRTAAGARVNAVAPGWTVSPMTSRDLDAALVERVTRTMPLRKVATADDVARAIVWRPTPLAAGHDTGALVTGAGGMEGRVLWGRPGGRRLAPPVPPDPPPRAPAPNPPR